MVRPFCHNFDVPVITGIMTTLIVAVALAVLRQITSLASHQCDILFNASSSNATQELIPLDTIQKWLDLARDKLALTVKGWLMLYGLSYLFPFSSSKWPSLFWAERPKPSTCRAIKAWLSGYLWLFRKALTKLMSLTRQFAYF